MGRPVKMEGSQLELTATAIVHVRLATQEQTVNTKYALTASTIKYAKMEAHQKETITEFVSVNAQDFSLAQIVNRQLTV